MPELNNTLAIANSVNSNSKLNIKNILKVYKLEAIVLACAMFFFLISLSFLVANNNTTSKQLQDRQNSEVVLTETKTSSPNTPISAVEPSPSPLNIQDNEIRKIFPDKRIAYTWRKDNSQVIYNSNVDFSDKKLILNTESKGYITDLKIIDNVIYFTGKLDSGYSSPVYNIPEQVYKLNKDGSGLTQLSNIGFVDNDTKTYIDLNALKLITIQQSQEYTFNQKSLYSKLWISNLDGSNKQLIRDRNFGRSYMENVESFAISKNAKRISYLVKRTNLSSSSAENRIITVDTNGQNAKDIYSSKDLIKGRVLTYDSGGNILYYYYIVEKNSRFVSEIVAYNFTTGESKNVAVIQKDDLEDFIFDFKNDELYFLANVSNRAVYSYKTDSGKLEQVIASGFARSILFFDEDLSLIYINSENGVTPIYNNNLWGQYNLNN